MSVPGVNCGGIEPSQALFATICLHCAHRVSRAPTSRRCSRRAMRSMRSSTPRTRSNPICRPRSSARQTPSTLNRIARQYALSMNDTKSEEQQRELGETALAYAKRAVAADPNNAKAQLSAAICYGRLVSFVGAQHEGGVLAAHQGARGDRAEARPDGLVCVARARRVELRARARWARSRARIVKRGVWRHPAGLERRSRAAVPEGRRAGAGARVASRGAGSRVSWRSGRRSEARAELRDGARAAEPGER